MLESNEVWSKIVIKGMFHSVQNKLLDGKDVKDPLGKFKKKNENELDLTIMNKKSLKAEHSHQIIELLAQQKTNILCLLRVQRKNDQIWMQPFWHSCLLATL